MAAIIHIDLLANTSVGGSALRAIAVNATVTEAKGARSCNRSQSQLGDCGKARQQILRSSIGLKTYPDPVIYLA